MNFEHFSSSDVFDALEDSGYIVKRTERNFAAAYDLCEYMGTSNTGVGQFLVGFSDPETLYGVNVTTVYIDSNGEGQYGAMPVFGGSLDDATAFIEKSKQKTITVAELKRNLINTLATLNKFDDNIAFEEYRSFNLDVEAGDDDQRFKLVTRFVK